MRILVTGANGLLGQKLVALLQAVPDVHLIATARSASVVPIEDGEFHLLDITNSAQTLDVILGTRPDVVINTAAMTQVDDCELHHDACWTANVTSVGNLVTACAQTGARLIHLSTDFIFDGTRAHLDEEAEAAPVNYYGESKLAAEKLVMDSPLKWCIIRTVLVYGISKDMSRSNIVLWVKKNLEAGKKIKVVSDQWRTPTLAEDLAEGCYLAAVNEVTGIFHIAGKDFLSPYQIALEAADFFQLDKSLIEEADSTTFTQPAKRPPITGFSIEKARRVLGYEPHSFREGIAVMASQMA